MDDDLGEAVAIAAGQVAVIDFVCPRCHGTTTLMGRLEVAPDQGQPTIGCRQCGVALVFSLSPVVAIPD